jgi:hypothetical protein
MKKIVMMFSLLLTLNVFAHIDEASMKLTEPKSGEVDSARSCFSEFETLGCGHPRDDLEHFKSCMENVFSSVTPKCQKIMGGLYRKKN